MMEVVIERASDDQVDTTTTMRTTSNATEPVRMCLRLRLMTLTARLEQKNPSGAINVEEVSYRADEEHCPCSGQVCR